MLMFLVLYLGRQQLVNNHSVRLESVPLFFALQAVITLWYYTSNTAKRQIESEALPLHSFFLKLMLKKAGGSERKIEWMQRVHVLHFTKQLNELFPFADIC